MNQQLITFFIGAITGLLSGIQGMAGSIYIVFSLLFFNLVKDQQEAAGTTLIYTSIPLTLGGAYIYYKKNKINFKVLSILIPTAFIFCIIGSYLNFKIPEKFTFLSLSIITFLMSIYYFKKFYSN
jgi:uncharacterized membrane protein YfcA